MKRLLVAADDREFATSLATDLEASATSNPGRWEVAKARTGLEAFLLLDRGELPFDALVVDLPLPDQGALAFMNRVRSIEAGRDLPTYLLVEHDLQRPDSGLSRLAAEAPVTTQLLSKPVAFETLRGHLDRLTAPLRILLAEGQDELRARYTRLLKRAGYQVEALATGREAVERQPRLRPAAVVASLRLPDVSGYEVFEQIRRAAVEPTSKVILYGPFADLPTGAPGGAARSSSSPRRPDLFLPTPFDDALLVDRVDGLLGRRRILRRMPAADLTSEAPTLETPELDPSAGVEARERSERRRHPRVPCRIQVWVQGEGRQFKGETFNVSPGGVFLFVDQLVPVGTNLELLLDLHDGEPAVRAQAQVTRVAPNGPGSIPRQGSPQPETVRPGIGARFLLMDPGDIDRLRSYLAGYGRR